MQVIECRQYDAKWWEVRRGIPTASEFSNILTPSKGELSKQAEAYACRLIADRFDTFYGHTDEYVSAAMKNGSLMEPEARRYYEFDRDTEVEQVGFVLTDDGRFGCSPDSLVGAEGGLELKSPAPHTHVRYLLDDCLPLEHKCQVHGCMIVTGRDWWDFMSYVPGFPKLLLRVERDDFTDKLAKALDDFDMLYRDLYQRIVAGREEAIEDAIEKQEPEPSYW